MTRVVVIGAGVAGLTAARAISTARPDWPLTVLEAARRPGGKLLTTQVDGYTFEHASTAVLAGRPETASLIADLGLADRVEPATAAARKQALYVHGGLHPVPGTPLEALRSPILSPRGKLRVLGEPLLGRRRAGVDVDESVHEFAARRFGEEFARVVAQTALLGVGAGDAGRTSLRAVFPQLHRLDQMAGRTGLLGQALRAARRPRPPSTMATFRDGGLNVLAEALSASLGNRIRCGVRAYEIRPGARRRYAVLLDAGEPLEADTVIAAVPSYEAAALLRGLAPGAAALLDELPYMGLRVLGLGYRRGDLPCDFDGFGFLVAPSEHLGILAAVISSNLFPRQAPAGRVLVRVFMGGWPEPSLAHCVPAEALRVARSALDQTLNITAAPELVLDAPWPKGIPQYRPGHLGWLDEVAGGISALPGLHLAGSAYRGLGIDDVIRDAVALAGRSTRQEAASA